jgi:hypothetical protein
MIIGTLACNSIGLPAKNQGYRINMATEKNIVLVISHFTGDVVA